MNDDTKLNEVLLKREIPQASTNLASRIAMATKSKERGSLVNQILKEMSLMFLFPRPAYVAALCLVFGLVLGLQLQLQLETGDADIFITQDLLSFADIDEGDWL